MERFFCTHEPTNEHYLGKPIPSDNKLDMDYFYDHELVAYYIVDWNKYPSETSKGSFFINLKTALN